MPFIKLVRMIISPVIFCTVVTGIASMHDMQQGWPRRRQGAALFRSRIDARTGDRLAGRACAQPRARASTSTRRRSTPAPYRAMRRRPRRATARRILHARHPRDVRRRIHAGRHPAGAADRDAVRHGTGGDGRTRRAGHRFDRTLVESVLPHRRDDHESRADWRVRRDGLHDRPATALSRCCR